MRQIGTILSLGCLLASMSTGCDTGTEVTVGKTVNSPPSAVILSPGNGEIFEEDTVIHFQAKVQDSFDAPTDLDVMWSSDVQGDLNSSALPDIEGNILFSTANLDVGTHVVTLTVWDSDAAQSQATVMLEILDLPEDPTIEIIQPTGEDSAIESYPFTMIVQTWDARDDLNTLDVTMESNLDGEICQTNPSTTGMAECDAFLNAGTHLLTFTVENEAGYDASATAYFDVISVLDMDDDGDGFTENQGDCDDNDPTVNPSQSEVENTLDDNCNGVVDEGTDAFDDDNDGYSENQGDCNDANPAVAPNATEICGNGIDDNCNNTQDEQNAMNCTTYFRDSDGDGYGDTNLTECWCQPGGSTGEFVVSNGNDCYDGNADANPTQTGFFSMHRGDGSFNYDCSVDSNGNPTIEKEYNTSGSCSSWGSSIGDCTINTVGWDGGIPGCGGTGNYLLDNDSCSGSCNFLGVPTCCVEGGPSYGARIQRCR